MEVDEEASEFGDDFEIEVSSFHRESGRASADWGSGSGEEEKEDSKGEDLMGIDQPWANN
jgi:hypothetical protein